LTCCSFVIDVYVNVWYFHKVFRFVWDFVVFPDGAYPCPIGNITQERSRSFPCFLLYFAVLQERRFGEGAYQTRHKTWNVFPGTVGEGAYQPRLLITILLTCCSFVIDVYVNVWYFHKVFRFVWDFVVFRVLGGISTLLILLLLRQR
jgi:hypothetical protein